MAASERSQTGARMRPNSTKPPVSRRVVRGKKPSPALVKQASEVSQVARASRADDGGGDGGGGGGGGGGGASSAEPMSRPRNVSQTDLIDELQATFALFDHDHNGYIDHMEISVFMRSLGFAPSEEKLRELVDQHDVNRDGQLDFGEFCALLTKAKSGGLFAEAIGEELRTLSSSTAASAAAGEESSGPKPESSKGSNTLSAADIRQMMTEIRRHTGQVISDDEIEDVIAMVEANEDKGRGRSVTIEQVQEYIAMPSKLRHEKAAPQRSMAHKPMPPPKSILELRGESQSSNVSSASIEMHPTI